MKVTKISSIEPLHMGNRDKPKKEKKKPKKEAETLVEAIYKKRHEKQKEAAEKAYPKLTRGRSTEAYFESLTTFYEPFGIIPTKGD